MTANFSISSKLLMPRRIKFSKAGEIFVLMLNKGKDTGMSLDTFRYISYNCMIEMSQKKVNSSLGAIELETPPPTSAAIKYHTHRTYFAVQEWYIKSN